MTGWSDCFVSELILLYNNLQILTFLGEIDSQLSIMSDFITPGTELSVFQSVQSSSLRPPGLVHVGYIDTPVPAVDRNISLHPEIWNNLSPRKPSIGVKCQC